MTYPGAPQQPEPWQGGNPSGQWPGQQNQPPQGPPPSGYPQGPPPPGYPQGPPPPGAYGTPAYPPVAYGAPGYPPGAYGAPGYPAAQGYQPPPRKRRKWPWIVSGSVVVVVAALIVVGLVFARKGSGDPHTAVRNFWNALVAHDTKKAQDYVCSKRDLTNDSTFRTAVNDITGYDIGAESGSGSTRTYPVTVHLTVAGQNDDETVITTVTKDTGQWYVCDLTRG